MTRFLLAVSLIATAVLILTGCGGNRTALVNEARSTHVTSTSATFNDKGDCDSGMPNSCYRYLEYGTKNQYQFKVPIQQPCVGCNSRGARRTLSVSGLAPDTTYQYRLCGNHNMVSSYACVGPDGAPTTTQSFTTSSCDKYAAPTGSDRSGDGSFLKPYATPQTLVNSLRSGLTGCLRAGTYTQDVTVRHGGTPGSVITLTSYPGDSATTTIVGRLWIAADFVTVARLHLDGRNANGLPSPTISASSVTLSANDVTDDHTGICVVVGSHTYGVAANVVISHNRIHDCGVITPGGTTTNLDHGIYDEASQNTTIEFNLIYANADRGIQFYPDAQNTTVDHNVIDSNGEGVDLSGCCGYVSSNNSVYDNLITNSKLGFDVYSYYPEGTPVGTRNTLYDNCVFGGHLGTIDISSGGFTASSNRIANPQYFDPAHHDYHLKRASACLTITGDIAGMVDGTTS